MKQSISILFQANDNVDDINNMVYVVHGRICRTGNIAGLPRVACYFSLQWKSGRLKLFAYVDLGRCVELINCTSSQKQVPIRIFSIFKYDRIAVS